MPSQMNKQTFLAEIRATREPLAAVVGTSRRRIGRTAPGHEWLDPDLDIDAQNRSILEEFRDRDPDEVRDGSRRAGSRA